ncbi:MAG: PAS domain S-box protein [Ktedonobacterales bacterium]
MQKKRLTHARLEMKHEAIAPELLSHDGHLSSTVPASTVPAEVVEQVQSSSAHDHCADAAPDVNSIVGLPSMSHRERAEEGLAYLAAIVTSADDAIVSKTLDGIVTSWNVSAERMFGYTAEEMIGQPITRLFPPDRLKEEDRILARIRAGERIEHFETVRVTKDGRPLDVSLTISPVRNSVGVIIGASKIARDITERKRAEQALREANHRMDEFLHTATHELRTPLTALQANLQIMDRSIQRLIASMPDQSEPTLKTAEAYHVINALVPRDALQTVARFISTNQRQVHRLTRLVDDLVDAARIQAEKLEIRTAPCDLAAITREAVAEQQAVQPKRQIALDIPEGLTIPIQADADRIGQVVTNYLTNALKYSPAERPVKVALRLDGATARVTVHDNGPGIPTEEQPHVWERGHRVPGIESSGQGVGLGLGLHISRNIIERHAGQVGVQSAPGEGSAFWFTLPLAGSD